MLRGVDLRKYMFADEAGDFEFSRKPNVSRYFVICTVTMNNCGIAHRLLDLRRELIWARYPAAVDIRPMSAGSRLLYVGYPA